MLEHRRDLKKEDYSHMLNHWLEHHEEDAEPPEFEFKIVNFCRDALTRQVGEAVRIYLRKNTLNSKAGYNRSGIVRLAVYEEDKSEEEISHQAGIRKKLTRLYE